MVGGGFDRAYLRECAYPTSTTANYGSEDRARWGFRGGGARGRSSLAVLKSPHTENFYSMVYLEVRRRNQVNPDITQSGGYSSTLYISSWNHDYRD